MNSILTKYFHFKLFWSIYKSRHKNIWEKIALTKLELFSKLDYQNYKEKYLNIALKKKYTISGFITNSGNLGFL